MHSRTPANKSLSSIVLANMTLDTYHQLNSLFSCASLAAGLDLCYVPFQDMLVSLNEVANVFKCLRDCSVGLTVQERPGYASIFMAFLVALAQNQKKHEEEISFDALLFVYGESTEDGHLDEKTHALYLCTLNAAKELEQAWKKTGASVKELSKLLSGKVQNVVFNYAVEEIV